VSAVRSAVEDMASGVRTSVTEARRSVEQAVSRAAESLRQAGVEERDRLASRLSGPLAAVETGLARVDRLSEVIDSLGHRRGFRELVESEEALRKEQAAFVDRLSETAAGVTEQVRSLEERLASLRGDLENVAAQAAGMGKLPGQASERVVAAMEAVRSSIEESLDRRFAAAVDAALREVRAELERGVPVGEVLARLEAVAVTQGELTTAHHQVEGLADALRTEVGELRATIHAWGRPHTVPEVAIRADDLEERVAALEDRVAGLAEAVADRVTAKVVDALDRRKRGLLRR
jgi:cell division septum initiation protein DivIVA